MTTTFTTVNFKSWISAILCLVLKYFLLPGLNLLEAFQRIANNLVIYTLFWTRSVNVWFIHT